MVANPTKIIQRQKAAVNAADEMRLEDISRVYALLYDRLRGNVDALMQAIEGLDNPTAAEVKRLPQYKELLRRARYELDRFEGYLETTIESTALAAIVMGLAHSSEFVRASGVRGFQSLRPQVITPLLKYLDPDGPLYARLRELTGATVESVVQTIIDGVGSGYNPRKIAAMVQDSFGGGLTDALRNTRTVQLWSYRESARANYLATDGIVTGWIWFATLNDDRTCEACIAEHGTIHGLDETLDGHYNCRCAAVPYIEGMTDNVQSGEEWFKSQAEDVQRNILGPGKFDAWQEGKFEFSQLAKQVDNEVYGTMRVVAPLKELIGGEE